MTRTEPLEALAQADLLLLAARLLRATSPDAFATVAAGDVRELATRSRLVDRPEAMRALEETVAAARSTGPELWSDEHSRLFEGSTACPPNETAFVRRDKGAVLADVCGFYRAFGFELSPDVGEKADHAVTELEYTAMLLVMLARAREAGDREAELVTSGGLAAFVRDHLDEWLPAFCEHLAETTTLPVYRGVAGLLGETLETLIERHSLPRAVPSHPTPCLADSGTPYECGMVPPCAAPSSTGT
ncbi:MAG: TorD/DmsD family molecular chaperone [Candidatus Eiseniibacteriota bacterium]